MKSVAEEKREFRKSVRKITDLSDSERKDISRKISEGVLGLKEFSECKSLFAFVGIGNEPDTRYLIEYALSQGKKVSVPLCRNDGIMIAKEIHSLLELKQGKYGIPEPDEYSIDVQPCDIDFILVPCVACSLDGRRLGHGKGYYDKFLPKTDALRVMISAQRFVFDDVPVDEFDCRADYIVTENKCRKADLRY